MGGGGGAPPTKRAENTYRILLLQDGNEGVSQLLQILSSWQSQI